MRVVITILSLLMFSGCTAMLVGAAHLLTARRHDLCGRIRFMFQPGEEGHFGARHMIDEGRLREALGEPPIAA